MLTSSGPMVGEGIPQINHSHIKSSGLYRKIHMKTGIDQELGGASLQATSIVDLFLLLQVSWTQQSNKGSRGEREEEEKSSKKSQNKKGTNNGTSKIGAPLL